MLIESLIIAQIGTGLIALSMQKHHRQVFAGTVLRPRIKTLFVLTGSALLAVAFTLLAEEQSVALALTEFSGIITINVLAVAWFLGMNKTKGKG